MAMRFREGLAQRAGQRTLALKIQLPHGHGLGSDVQEAPSWGSGLFAGGS